jgi:carboxypeptidase PM20D1
MGKRIAWAVVAVVGLLTTSVLVNTLRIGKDLPSRNEVADEKVDADEVAKHLSGALRIATVSHENPADDDTSARTQLVDYLKTTFPHVHETMTKESVRGGLLFTWKGSDSSLPPVLFAAHMDVVPATEGWRHAPFSGDLAEGFVWGRGALDDKGSLICLLEAAERLIAAGEKPQRTLLFAFGADEEVGGEDARAIAALLKSRNLPIQWALDEGMAVTEGIVKEVAAPIALIGIGEKGYVSVALSLEGEGGHASMPPRETTIGIMAAALKRIVDAPGDNRLEGVARLQMQTLAPYMPFAQRMIVGNPWLFSSLESKMMAQKPATAAMLHTTLAPTIFAAGEKDNVLPSKARAVVNARIIPGERVETVLERVKSEIRDPRIRVEKLERSAHDPPALAPINGDYRRIETAIGRVFPKAVISPALVVGATDGRHYQPLANGVYRFAPFILRPDDLARLHGIDERVKIDELIFAVRGYMELIKQAEKSN